MNPNVSDTYGGEKVPNEEFDKKNQTEAGEQTASGYKENPEEKKEDENA